jgi:branched-chain amino acid transport system ATP-binding protein
MLLSVENLDVFYGVIQALHGVTLNIDRGEIVTLIGANGAGKTTLLRTISGLIRPERGRIILQGGGVPADAATARSSSSPSPASSSSPSPILDYQGEPVGVALHTLPPHEVVSLGVSHVPEGRQVFSTLTVRENLLLGAYQQTARERVARDLDRCFGLFPILAERRGQRAGTLSGGEQQMLAIGRALMARPQILLLDEPSLGLAPLVVRKIFQIIRDINAAGTTVFLVEQNAHMALNIANRAYVLQTGRIIKEGPARAMLEDPDVKKAYLGG